MSYTWHSEDMPAPVRLDAAGWARVVLRGAPLAAVVVASLALLVVLRLAEQPLFGQRRPVTAFVAQAGCRAALGALGLRRRVHGRPIRRGGAFVANHASWLDILVLGAGKRVFFVSKSDVRSWPGIGWLTRAAGTVFINRRAQEARAHRDLLSQRLGHGHKLLFFPEGTSTDGRRVLPFRTALFEAFFDRGLADGLLLQPVAVIYHAPAGADARFYGWWGDMTFGAHLLKVLAAPRQGSVDVVYLDPVRVSDFAHRKALAAACQAAVSQEVQRRIGGPG